MVSGWWLLLLLLCEWLYLCLHACVCERVQCLCSRSSTYEQEVLDGCFCISVLMEG